MSTPPPAEPLGSDDEGPRRDLAQASPTEAARVALAGGAMGILAVFVTCGFTLAALAMTGDSVLSGGQILVAFGVVALVFLVFLAFVFGRLLRIRAARGDDSIEVDAGDHAH